MGETPIVIARDLIHALGETQVLRGLSFDVGAGEGYAVVGPSGAGKSALAALVACQTPPDHGQLKVLGRDVQSGARAIRCQIGTVPQADTLDPDLSIRDCLRVQAALFGLARAEARRRSEELLRFLGLDELAGLRVSALTPAPRRRLAIARALIHRPELLVLDEPTEGLEAGVRQMLWQRLRSLKAQGTTLFVCTRSNDDALALADRVALLDRGCFLAEGLPDEIVQAHAGGDVLFLPGLAVDQERAIAEQFARLSPPQNLQRSNGGLRCILRPGEELPGEILELTRALALTVTLRPASLADAFALLSGRELAP